MPATLTSKGQVTIPKKVRDALKLVPGSMVDFSVNRDGHVELRKMELRKADKRPMRKIDRFDAARGRAPVKWRTDDLMTLLRGTD